MKAEAKPTNGIMEKHFGFKSKELKLQFLQEWILVILWFKKNDNKKRQCCSLRSDVKNDGNSKPWTPGLLAYWGYFALILPRKTLFTAVWF